MLQKREQTPTSGSNEEEKKKTLIPNLDTELYHHVRVLCTEFLIAAAVHFYRLHIFATCSYDVCQR
jgi:hypothetical protein